jgi:phosphotriesterase-related protein
MSEAATATTVLGPVPVERLGATMTHEHLFVDLTVWFNPQSADEDHEAPVEMPMLGQLRRDAFSITRDNLRLRDARLAAAEVERFASAGGGTIVDLTPADLARDPEALRALAERTGVNVIMGCGYYVEAAHPPHVAGLTADEIAAELVSELTGGVGDTGIRPGIIGEIGTSGADPETGRKSGHVTEQEERVLRGAARAATETGVAVSVHLDPRGEGGDRVLDILESESLPPERIVLGHLDHVPSVDYHLRLADRGVYVQYDNFGREYYWDAEGVYWNNDHWRVNALTELVARGHLGQLLVSQDVAFKMDLRAYGGYGYDHVLVDIVPALHRAGLSDADVHAILVENPSAVLAAPVPSGVRRA